MEGPFASVADWCNLHPNPNPDAAQGDPDHAADYGYTCNAGPDEELSTGSMSPAKLVAPWRTVRLLLVLTRYHGRGEGERMIEMYLAVETSAGWFASRPSLGTAPRPPTAAVPRSRRLRLSFRAARSSCTGRRSAAAATAAASLEGSGDMTWRWPVWVRPASRSTTHAPLLGQRQVRRVRTNRRRHARQVDQQARLRLRCRCWQK